MDTVSSSTLTQREAKVFINFTSMFLAEGK